MAGINIAVDSDEWYSTIRAFRSMPAGIKREVAKRGRHLAEPLAKEIRDNGLRSPKSMHARRVATTVEAGMLGGVPSVTAGGLPYTMGSEWGGRVRFVEIRLRPTVFGRRVPPFERHTTMQFRKHRGVKGYWFSPTLRSSEGINAVLNGWRDLLDDVIARM